MSHVDQMQVTGCCILLTAVGFGFGCGKETPPLGNTSTQDGGVGAGTGAASGAGSAAASGSASDLDGGSGGGLRDFDPNDPWGPGDPELCTGANSLDVCDQDTDCPSSLYVCVPGGCEGRGYCSLKGASCVDSGSCPANANCQIVGSNGVCTSNDSFCLDSRTCPLDWVCEGSPGLKKCEDRRLPCTQHAQCPPGFGCLLKQGAAASYCAFLQVQCDPMSSGQCLIAPYNQCVDLNNDGQGQCFTGQGCQAHSDCTGFERCTATALGDTVTGQCKRFGACSLDEDCNDVAGDRCFDRHGNGALMCTPSSFCSFDAQCPTFSRCFDTDDDGYTECACFDPFTGAVGPC